MDEIIQGDEVISDEMIDILSTIDEEVMALVMVSIGDNISPLLASLLMAEGENG
jgi:hypothetical protein